MMPQDDVDRRILELAHAALHALHALHSGSPEDWMGAVQQLACLGDLANGFLADYRAAQTVELEPSPDGGTVYCQISFSPEELAELRRWGGQDRHLGAVVHDAALECLRAHEGVRIALAKVKGSEPTRAEVLTGLTLRDLPERS